MWNPFHKKLNPTVEAAVAKSENLEFAMACLYMLAHHPEMVPDAMLVQEMRNFIASTEARTEELLTQAAALIREKRPEGFKLYQDAARESGRKGNILERVFLSPKP